MPSFSTIVYRYPEQYLSNLLTSSLGVSLVDFVQPCVVTFPSFASIATSSLDLGSFERKSSSAAVPIIIFFAPFASILFAFSTVLIPPPTLQSATAHIFFMSSSLFPLPTAASRSITASSPNLP